MAEEKEREEARKREDALFNERSTLSAHYKKEHENGVSEGRVQLHKPHRLKRTPRRSTAGDDYLLKGRSK